MNDHPNALELVRIAYQTLAQDVLPSARPEHLYALRMIANALGIATRELESHDANAAAEARSLATLYGETQNTLDLQSRNRQFAQDIRHGAFESNTAAAALRQHLLTTARAKLAAAYPKALSTNK